MVKNQKNQGKDKTSVSVYFEGGGAQAELHDEVRKAFRVFFAKTDIKGHQPKIIPCGGREQAYDKYCTAVKCGEKYLLLVDSEELVAKNCSSAWAHFKNRGGDKHWKKPENASNDNAHLMVCCMESWFLADREVLKQYFGQGYKEAKLPDITKGIENVSKNAVLDGLKQATKECKTKLTYNKGTHSFELIGLLDPAKVENASPWAKKLFDKLRETCKS